MSSGPGPLGTSPRNDVPSRVSFVRSTALRPKPRKTPKPMITAPLSPSTQDAAAGAGPSASGSSAIATPSAVTPTAEIMSTAFDTRL